jgi:hypothetical protein
VTPAADWFAVGVMRYEVLVGKRPFEGSPMEMSAKEEERFRPPSSLVPGRLGHFERPLCGAIVT